MIKKKMLHLGRTDCRIPGNDIAEGPSGQICCHSPCSLVSRPVYIDKDEKFERSLVLIICFIFIYLQLW